MGPSEGNNSTSKSGIDHSNASHNNKNRSFNEDMSLDSIEINHVEPPNLTHNGFKGNHSQTSSEDNEIKGDYKRGASAS